MSTFYLVHYLCAAQDTPWSTDVFIDGQYGDFLLMPVKGLGISILVLLLDNNTGEYVL